MTYDKMAFENRLFQLIREKGMKDTDVYKAAGMSRQDFSKIQNGMVPGKYKILGMALALELDLGQTEDLLARAGLMLSPQSRLDRLVSHCIECGVWDSDGFIL